MHVDFKEKCNEPEFQSVNFESPKVQNDTLECTLEDIAILKLIAENPAITQKELAMQTGKSVSSIKRAMASLQKKQYIPRVNGKRYGTWQIQIEIK